MSLNPKNLLNVSNFLSQVRKSGYARASKVAIAILPPSQLLNTLRFKLPSLLQNDFLTYYSESVAFPGLNISLNNMNYGGPLMKVPVSTDYNEVQITFLVDDEMRQKTFFDAWMNFINPKENKFDFRYRDDYIGEVLILQLSETGKYFPYAVKLFEAFPVSMNEIRGSWADAGEAVRLDVTFSYRYWKNLRSSDFERDDANAEEDVIGIDIESKDTPEVVGIDIFSRRKEELVGIDIRSRRGTEGTEIVGIDIGSTSARPRNRNS